MRLDWRADGPYSEIGGQEMLREALEDARAVLPSEHLRQLGVLLILDHDPKGRALGLWRQDHEGVGIDLYLDPHVDALLPLPPRVRDFALRLHLAYTLFHEVGHHVTRLLNRRAAPPRKAALVDQKIERWADEYAEKRLGKLVARWLAPGGRADAPEARRALAYALRSLRLDSIISLDVPGTTEAVPAS